MFKERKILIGITGSIAAYKIPALVRLFTKEGAEVKVIMTTSATDFVSKLTLSTLSRSSVFTDLFKDDAWSNHVMLGRWADLFIIAPLSCNTLAKMAHGQCDNLLLATYLSATCPVIIAPAMDDDMWKHPATKANLQTLISNGCQLIPAEYGELASGLVGEGRMAEPETIKDYTAELLKSQSQFVGKKVLVTAGPTYEPLDPVRFLGNHSSGKMGYAIADEFSKRGADVTLVTGPVDLQPGSKLKLVKTQTATEMYNACLENNDYDIAVMAAAVADYKPINVSKEKIKKNGDAFNLELEKTQDILQSLGEKKNKGQILVGFALETNNEDQNATKKLSAKHADMIVLNSLNDNGAGFKHDTNKITIYFSDGRKQAYETKSKSLVAKDIVDSIKDLLK